MIKQIYLVKSNDAQCSGQLNTGRGFLQPTTTTTMTICQMMMITEHIEWQCKYAFDNRHRHEYCPVQITYDKLCLSFGCSTVE